MKTQKKKLPLTRLTLRPLEASETARARGGQAPVRTVVLPSDACGVAF